MTCPHWCRAMPPSPTRLLSSVYTGPQSTLLSAASALVPDLKASLDSTISYISCLLLGSGRSCCSDITLVSGDLCGARTLCLWYPPLWCRGMAPLGPCRVGLGGLNAWGCLRTTCWTSSAVTFVPGTYTPWITDHCQNSGVHTRGFYSIPAPPNLTGVYGSHPLPQLQGSAPKVSVSLSFRPRPLSLGSRSGKLDISHLILTSLRPKVFGTQTQTSGRFVTSSIHMPSPPDAMSEAPWGSCPPWRRYQKRQICTQGKPPCSPDLPCWGHTALPNNLLAESPHSLCPTRQGTAECIWLKNGSKSGG